MNYSLPSGKTVLAGGLFFFLLLSFAFLPQFSERAHAQPEGFFVETIAGGLTLPTSMAFTPDGRSIFIAQKNGSVRIYRDGVLLPEPFITLSDVNTYNDRGLLGIAIDPNFETNRYVYLSYTFENVPGTSPGDPAFTAPKTGRIVRVQADGDTANTATLEILVGSVGGDAANPSCDDFATTADCIPSDASTHSVGGLRFGPDGFLYATLGDGADFLFADPRAFRALDLDSLAGKMIRINTDGTAPADNPFFTGDPDANRSKVWARGLRNAFRFNFRPSNGSLYLGEVGWSDWESIFVVPRGANLGWPCHEGFTQTPGYNCFVEDRTDPIHVYSHDPFGTGAVVGGTFPLHGVYPDEYMGNYIFGDYSQNWIRRMIVDESDNVIFVEDFIPNPGGPVDILTGPDGYIYFLSIFTGELRRISHAQNAPPVAHASAAPLSGPAPLTVLFSSDGSFDPESGPLSYAWDFGDGNVSSASHPTHTYFDEGVFSATLTVFDQEGASDSATIIIRVGEGFPADADPTHIGTETSPSTHFIGRDVHIETTIENRGAPDPIVVNIEIFDEAGVRVGQRFFEDVVIGSGERVVFTHDWFPPEVGSYRVDVGLFHQGWSGLYEWAYGTSFFNVIPRSAEDRAFAPRFSSASAQPPEAAAGETVMLHADIENTGGAGFALIDIEVYDESGAQVFQRFFNNEFFAADETRRFSVPWQPALPGTYRVSVGIFEANWASIIEWADSVAIVSVSGEGDPEGPVSVVHQTTAVDNTTPAVGEEVAVQTTVQNTGGSGSALVNIEVYTEDGRQMAQIFFDDEFFGAGESKTYPLLWTPIEEGTHIVRVGIFDPGWTSIRQWVDDAAHVTVTSSGERPPLSIYSDALASGWENWSWDTIVDLSASDFVFEGSSAIHAEFTAPWAGLYLHSGALDTTGYSTLSFAISAASTGGQSLGVFVYDELGNIPALVLLSDYLPETMQPHTWYEVSIPLSDVGAFESTIMGFVVQGRSDSVEPPFYVDRIILH